MIIAFELICKIPCSSDWIKFSCVESLKSDFRGMMRSLVMKQSLIHSIFIFLAQIFKQGQ